MRDKYTDIDFDWLRLFFQFYNQIVTAKDLNVLVVKKVKNAKTKTLQNFDEEKIVKDNYEKQDFEKLDIETLDELEKNILHKLFVMDKSVKDNLKNYNFHKLYKELLNFCTLDLSSFYFDIRKDVLYCDNLNSKKITWDSRVESLYLLHR